MHTKGNHFKKMKRQIIDWGKMFGNTATENEINTKINKQFIQLNNEKNNNPIEKWAEDLN